jgi:ATP-dependent Clp protease ATP-binding subunit ClpC
VKPGLNAAPFKPTTFKVAPFRPAPPKAPAPPKSAPAKGTPAVPAKKLVSDDAFVLDPKRFPLLTELGKNLTLAARRDEIDPVVGREDEIEMVLDVLAKRTANNPCLVGAAGVGKTSIARGVATHMASLDASRAAEVRLVIEIEPGALLAGTGHRGALAERIARLRVEIARSRDRVVLFFDEIQTLFGGDAGEEAASELKRALGAGELPCIGATTPEEYRRAIDSDAALARRFTAVEVEELAPEEAFLALEKVVPLFAKHHGLAYAEKAVAASVTWSVRYVPSKALPDKAVSILDLAGARAGRRGQKEVTPEGVAEVVSELASVPIERLLESDGERMLRLEAILGERIVGHHDAIARIAAVLRKSASGFRSRRPIGCFLLLGPTGVGKTETAKAVAECLFASPDAMTRLDLSEYAEPHAVARLVGAPPGYVGHDAGGQLTETVRRRPYQVVLLDEIEKAHRDVLEAFLQVFDEGRMTDGRGRTVDFRNTVFFLTSNLGADVALPSSAPRMGFAAKRAVSAADRADYARGVTLAARAALPPELYNRLDEVLTFAPLDRADVAEIARRMLRELSVELEAMRGIRLEVGTAAIEALLENGGFEPSLGARPMRRAIARQIEAPLAELLLREDIGRGDVAVVETTDGGLVVKKRPARQTLGPGAPSMARR